MLKKIDFDSIGFRNLKDISITLPSRLTVIAGHNGIGKSTILGLIANGSELKGYKTLLNKDFRAEFGELFFLDYYEDFESRTPEPSRADITYNLQGTTIIKECEVSGTQKKLVKKDKYKKFMVKVPISSLTEKQALDLKADSFYVYRMRVIPRTKNTKEISKTFLDENKLGQAAKVTIPTLYLGMSRMSPIGEFDQSAIQQKISETPKEIVEFIYEVFDSIIPFSDPLGEEDKTTFSHSFNESNKQSIVPNFGHSSLSISLGQDSLSSIATALASFKNLQTKMGEQYPGGILIIDEVEAGLHPRAQRNLIQTLKTQAKELKLQIIMTTHSLTIIKETLDENLPKKYRVDDVIYLMDTNVPYVMENPSYLKIKNDMLLEEVQPEILDKPTVVLPPKMYVYFEDLEAYDFFSAILRANKITDTMSSFGRELCLVPAKLGCHNLLNLSKSTPHFKDSLIILDSDTADLSDNSEAIKGALLMYPNVVILPVNDSASPFHGLPPDKLVYSYLLDKFINRNIDRDFWHNRSSNRLTTNFYLNHLKDIQKHYTSETLDPIHTLENVRNLKRDPMKKWYNAHRSTLETFDIFGLWAAENEKYCQIFLENVVQTIDKIIDQNAV
ncbi:AAA family ATPase [Acinetobacter oleivorans]|uniref:AAA family ATPase n=1 Tax=Acinetobacter oleivorans TaxID=1148157 RepID=UPI00148F132B|nr:AAA family ATPase [Acinetobacter oleivorans]